MIKNKQTELKGAKNKQNNACAVCEHNAGELHAVHDHKFCKECIYLLTQQFINLNAIQDTNTQIPCFFEPFRCT